MNSVNTGESTSASTASTSAPASSGSTTKAATNSVNTGESTSPSTASTSPASSGSTTKAATTSADTVESTSAPTAPTPAPTPSPTTSKAGTSAAPTMKVSTSAAPVKEETNCTENETICASNQEKTHCENKVCIAPRIETVCNESSAVNACENNTDGTTTCEDSTCRAVPQACWEFVKCASGSKIDSASKCKGAKCVDGDEDRARCCKEEGPPSGAWRGSSLSLSLLAAVVFSRQ